MSEDRLTTDEATDALVLVRARVALCDAIRDELGIERDDGDRALDAALREVDRRLERLPLVGGVARAAIVVLERGGEVRALGALARALADHAQLEREVAHARREAGS